MTPKQTAGQMIAICNHGFDNEHHWRAWLKKSKATILALPFPLRKAVLLAHEQATAKAFSEVPRNRLSRRPDGPDSGAGTSTPDANESEPK